MIKKSQASPYPQPNFTEKPFHGVTNTNFERDMGSLFRQSEVESNALKQRSFGVHPVPKAFQPFFRFDGATTGATIHPNHREVMGGVGVNQPESLAYKMESQGIKFTNGIKFAK